MTKKLVSYLFIVVLGLVLALNYLGITSILVATSALVAYIPLVIALAVLWYIQHKFF